MPTPRLATNSLYNVLGVGVNSLIALALTPYLLKYLGSDGFALWALCGMAIAGFALFDLGMPRWLARVIARHQASGQWSAVGRDFNSVFWSLALTTAILTATGLLIAPWVGQWLGMPASHVATGTAMLRLLILSAPAIVLASILSGALEGAQRMAYTNLALTASRLVFALGAALVIGFGLGPVHLAGAYLAAVCIQALLLILFIDRITPGLRFSLHLLDGPSFRQASRFGRPILATSLVALTYTFTNKLILAKSVSLQSVAYYEFASSIATYLFIVALALASALYPAFAAAQMDTDSGGVSHLYDRALRWFVMLFVPIGVALAALSAPLVSALADNAPPETAMSLRWLALGWTVVSVAAVASVGLQATGRPQRALACSMLNAALNLILAVVLTSRVGYPGVIAANVIAISVSATLTLLLFARASHLPLRQMVNALSLQIWGWAACLGLGFAWVAARTPQPTVASVAVLGVLFLAVYVLGLIAFRLLRSDERAWLRQHFAPAG